LQVKDKVNHRVSYQYPHIHIKHPQPQKSQTSSNYTQQLPSLAQLQHLSPPSQQLLKTLL
uniref:hypothetical protein n=1 Tax=Staphylococcus epidermidis TaxID=1282 RepID=UPI00164335AD